MLTEAVFLVALFPLAFCLVLFKAWVAIRIAEGVAPYFDRWMQ